jgi:hypothetical protein
MTNLVLEYYLFKNLLPFPFKPINLQKITFERSSSYNSTFHAAQHSLSGDSLYQGFSEYQKYIQLSDRFGH